MTSPSNFQTFASTPYLLRRKLLKLWLTLEPNVTSCYKITAYMMFPSKEKPSEWKNSNKYRVQVSRKSSLTLVNKVGWVALKKLSKTLSLRSERDGSTFMKLQKKHTNSVSSKSSLLWWISWCKTPFFHLERTQFVNLWPLWCNTSQRKPTFTRLQASRMFLKSHQNQFKRVDQRMRMQILVRKSQRVKWP